jgi:hypothetical protein
MSDETTEKRPQSVIAIYGGPTWSVLETIEEIEDLEDGLIGDQRLLLTAYQEDMEPARIRINPNLVATVFEVTDERYAADLEARHEREAQEKAQADAIAEARRRGLVPGGGGPGGGLV